MNSHPTLKPDYRTVTLKPGDKVALLTHHPDSLFVVVKDRGDGKIQVKGDDGAEWAYPRTLLVKTPTAAEVADKAPEAVPPSIHFDHVKEAYKSDGIPGLARSAEVTLTLDEAAAVVNKIMNPTYVPPVAEQKLLAAAAMRMTEAVILDNAEAERKSTTCGNTVGKWLGVDRWEPCYCLLAPDHEGGCKCSHAMGVHT